MAKVPVVVRSTSTVFGPVMRGMTRSDCVSEYPECWKSGLEVT
ncbi:hypothetical protein RGAI101_479 [Roseobacter sp. GAI101]|nr:hypothetical protein RGAI101_479 [Roseobacter sp. GAI101]